MDADCTCPPDAIPRLYAKLAHAEMVVGARALSSSGVAWRRRPGTWILNRLAGYLVGQRVPDLNSGQRVMKRDAVLSRTARLMIRSPLEPRRIFASATRPTFAS